MGNIFEKDFREFIQALNDNEVDYLLVGGYAVILHGYFRSTGDLDVWVEPTDVNYEKLMRAFVQFGLPTEAIPKTKFFNTIDYDVFRFGVAPLAIDLLTLVKGLNFKSSFDNKIERDLESLKVTLLCFKDLKKAKKAAGRMKDLNDIEHLKKKTGSNENG